MRDCTGKPTGRNPAEDLEGKARPEPHLGKGHAHTDERTLPGRALAQVAIYFRSMFLRPLLAASKKRIAEGKPENVGVRGVESTLTAILGRMAMDAKRLITWDEMMRSA